MSRETHYVLEDGSTADPREGKPDAAGVLRHRDGMAVAMRGDVPRSRGVDIDTQARDMKPAEHKTGYLTRDLGRGQSAEGDGGLAAARAEYETVFSKRPYHGWDAAALREKIAAQNKAD